MTPEQIASALREQVSGEIELEAAGPDDFTVHVPFQFDDGDHFVAVLRRDADRRWYFTDEGHTYMHLSYGGKDESLHRGNRRNLVEKAIAVHGLSEQEGQLVRPVQGEYFADALFAFVQGVGRIVGVADWTKKRVKDTFNEDFRAIMTKAVPTNLLTPDFKNANNDIYTATYRIDAQRRPWLVFAVANDSQCLEATISIRHFKEHFSFSSLAVHKDQTDLSRRHVAMLSDVVGKQFSSLADRDQITKYVEEEVLAS